MVVFRLPPAVEIGRLQRLKEAVCGGRQRRSSIVADEDWIYDIDARLSELERAIGPPTMNGPSAQEIHASHPSK